MEKLTKGKGNIFSINFFFIFLSKQELSIVTNEVVLQRNSNYCVLWKASTLVSEKPSYYITLSIYIYWARHYGLKESNIRHKDFRPFVRHACTTPPEI